MNLYYLGGKDPESDRGSFHITILASNLIEARRIALDYLWSLKQARLIPELQLKLTAKLEHPSIICSDLEDRKEHIHDRA